VQQGQLRKALQEADILFLPYSFLSGSRHSVETAFPSKMADYLAAGKPILIFAPASSTLARYAAEERFAELVTECDLPILAAAVRKLTLSPPRRRMLAERALAAFRRNHDIGRQRRRFYQLVWKMS
jgi:glycosyltransferase involved in cell wall biosynthesis